MVGDFNQSLFTNIGSWGLIKAEFDVLITRYMAGPQLNGLREGNKYL